MIKVKLTESADISLAFFIVLPRFINEIFKQLSVYLMNSSKR